MKVTGKISKATGPLCSYEIIPPKRGKSARDILDIVEQLRPFDPPFIDVTSHSPVTYYQELGDGTIKRRIRKKRPGTIGICTVIQNRYGIDSVPHLLCRGFTREETEDAMIELSYLGIESVMAIRGDSSDSDYKGPADSTVNLHANHLVAQLADLRRGVYLEDIANSEPIDCCIGVCGYPEKHAEAPNAKTDLTYLKAKVDAGADYIVTQMCFDNLKFFDFEKRCREAGIDIPIIPGLKIMNKVGQLSTLPGRFQVSLPETLVDEITENPKHVREIGIRWGVKQCEELFNHGVRCVHFYVLNDARSVTKVVSQLA